MDDELTPEQRFAADDSEAMVHRELSRGRSREELIIELMRLDWSAPAAASFVDRVADDMRRHRSRPKAAEISCGKPGVRWSSAAPCPYWGRASSSAYSSSRGAG